MTQIKNLLFTMVIQLSQAKPVAQKGPIVVHRGNSRDITRGHSFEEVKFLMANVDSWGIQRARPHRIFDQNFRPKFHLPTVTTDDEEILEHLMKANLVSRPLIRYHPRYPIKNSRKTVRKIPSSIFKDFKHLLANLPSDFEGSGY